MNRVSAEFAYVLHRRHYRETSFLVELFTLNYGRLTVLAKGAKSFKTGFAPLLQPFVPLKVNWVGRKDLMTLTGAESREHLPLLRGHALFAGFYVHELLLALLETWNAYPSLFNYYEKLLQTLAGGMNESALRIFEKQFLQEIGYGFFSFKEELSADVYYQFIFGQGFIAVTEKNQTAAPAIFKGEHLLHFARGTLTDALNLQEAKRLIRLILKELLPGRDIHSRRLF